MFNRVRLDYYNAVDLSCGLSQHENYFESHKMYALIMMS